VWREITMTEWELVGTCGVDSGQIIVVDPCYVISDESDLDKFKESGDYNDVDATYDELLKERDKGNSLTDAFKFGIVTNTGFGDGEYKVYIKKESQGDWGERVSELKIVFIEDDPEEEEDEY
tara:strand:+ start:50 stop:415 length:366 start_codon:yes stop_codon:yes gene_type:complete